MAGNWELFSHDADMGIRGIGPTFENAFEQAGLALTGVLIDPSQIEAKIPVNISCSDQKIDTLFYDWINELIYEMAHQHLIFGRFEVKISQDRQGQINLQGKAWGETIDLNRHPLAVEIKGATFTELKAEQNENNEYVVQCIVDV
ncbi:MAG: archease [Alphaproteobacteria bacterium 41-28]|nr:MAG: archease [Alphaproteobacteria bacterium 41-28]